MSEHAEFITDRQNRLRDVHDSRDVEKFLEWFTPDAEYSDHYVGVFHLNKTQLAELARSVFSSVEDMAYTTVSVSGAKTFTAWEWTCQATIAAKIPGIPAEVGEVVKMSGCSLFWWDMSGAGDGGDGKVKAMVEYSKGF